MKLIIFGATGMLGEATLIEALEDPGVQRVLSVVRRPTGRQHPKLDELIVADVSDFGAVQSDFAAVDACLWLLGTTSAGKSEAEYRRVTVGFTEAASRALVAANPDMHMVFVSGTGAEPGSSTMWKRVKAEGEAAALNAGFRQAHAVRPAGIFPRKGVRSRVWGYRVAYTLTSWAYPLIRRVWPGMTTTSDQLGRALIHLARHGHEKAVLENPDIVALCD